MTTLSKIKIHTFPKLMCHFVFYIHTYTHLVNYFHHHQWDHDFLQSVVRKQLWHGLLLKVIIEYFGLGLWLMVYERFLFYTWLFFVRPVEEKLIFSVRMPAKTLSSLLAAPNHSTLLCNHWYLFPFSSPLLLNHISSKFVWTDVCLACQWTDRPHQQTRLNPKVKSLVGLRV